MKYLGQTFTLPTSGPKTTQEDWDKIFNSNIFEREQFTGTGFDYLEDPYYTDNDGA